MRKLAVAAFEYLENVFHDSDYGGYFTWADRAGALIEVEAFTKDQNCTLHLIEAFTALYRVAPDTPLLRERLEELSAIMTEKIITPAGFMQYSFERDWTHQRVFPPTAKKEIMYNSIDFGHEFQVGYLLTDACRALGREGDTKVRAAVKKMVDFSLNNSGFSDTGGVPLSGLYDESSRTVSVQNESRIHYPQAEALNCLCMMSRMYPDNPLDYYGKMLTQWHYISRNFIDRIHGGWLRHENNYDFFKSTYYFGPYHQGRALSNCIGWLK
jgi:mannobiose 2-epimerase